MIGIFWGIVAPKLYMMSQSALYDRKAIEGLMDELIGKQNISATMFDEMLIVSYEYNS